MPSSFQTFLPTTKPAFLNKTTPPIRTSKKRVQKDSTQKITVEIHQDLYKEMKLYGIKNLSTNKEIISKALLQFLHN